VTRPELAVFVGCYALVLLLVACGPLLVGR
jgi:hypothetical protein